jgi:probable HAF family extracellular repeat protein
MVIEFAMKSAIDLNDAGDVLGEIHTGDGQTGPPYVSAVVWIAGANVEVLGCKDLMSNCARDYFPTAMNSNRRVIGQLVHRDSLERSAFFWQVGDDRVYEYAYAPWVLTDINDAGQMIGVEHPPRGYASAFLLHGTRIMLGDLGGYGGHARAINNTGHIAGDSPTRPDGFSHVFLWVDGAMQDLGTLDGASSYAADINMADEIVGSADNSVGTRAFLYANSRFTDLGSLGGAWSAAAAINNHGQIVGGSTLAGEEPQAQRAFLYVDGTMYDLNDLIEPIPDTLVFAGKINNRGQILAYGCAPSTDDDCRFYLLTPVSPF